MTAFTRSDLPADITVLSGDFASQPLVFAHLQDIAPELALDHVEVIQTGHLARLMADFSPQTAKQLAQDARTLVLILPAAHDGPDCPVTHTDHLTALGRFRGTVPQMRILP